ncbi:MAG: helix-hairpin-helix domain-containing protein [Bacteroidota bacterium]|nr:helix-hairpin-helix domain-containing protein [Bacteroidota bacterium]MDP4230966.1 helix-hairpin-helix domain-containing protein [Bacteroidota bacterium]MDP4235171.1 helix-hairpin-helix domain-containing protein [Bacteroidota bacterium]
MSFREFFSHVRSKAGDLASRLFTPKEFRALLFFLAVGFAVLLYRGGKELISAIFPPAAPNEFLAQERRNDSIFAELSRKVINEDSLKFSIPEDSVIVKEKQAFASGSKKIKDLPPHSIPLNKADAEILTKLPGVGKVTAERILLYRTKRGGFRDVHEVMNIQGIGEKKFKEMEAYLTLN